MPTTTTTKDDVVVDFGSIELSGTLLHDDQRRLLMLETDEGPEPISVNLQSHGITPEPGNVFIKDWSEHSGLTARLAQAGLVSACTRSPSGPSAPRPTRSR
ncbi:hypothetical protein ACF08M_30270 [Streptomyces sp. NPDC015032]|uniref:hypothetical protein n=1 Tax=Streptomyces sp. NPDC015032 TaxID=3364937 RepID=UPI0036F6F5B6